MRLLNVTSLEFKEFWGDHTPPYVILSHRWGEDEPTYNTFRDHQRRESKGYQKISGFVAAILRHDPDVSWLWVDTACIDKTNMVELSEAINSMFRWYRDAINCYVYLQDVIEDDIETSNWFTRGWTLQELLAPPKVQFFNQGWTWIGYKHPGRYMDYGHPFGLNERISSITGLPMSILGEFDPLDEVNIKRNMTWMNNRETTRPEDRYYSMLGIFAVYMLPIYGEGAEHAYSRLVKEIYNEHGPNSKIEGPKFHLLSSSYDGLNFDVRMGNTSFEIPQSAFRLAEPLTGTSYAVIKYKGAYQQVYEDGMIGERVEANVDHPDDASMRQQFLESGGYSIGSMMRLKASLTRLPAERHTLDVK